MITTCKHCSGKGSQVKTRQIDASVYAGDYHSPPTPGDYAPGRQCVECGAVHEVFRVGKTVNVRLVRLASRALHLCKFPTSIAFGPTDLPNMGIVTEVSPGQAAAAAFLAKILAAGPLDAATVRKKALKAKLNLSSLYRARNRIGAYAEFGQWALPESAPTRKTGKAR